MKRWEQLEDHITITGLNGGEFTAEALAVSMGISVPEATGMVQAYLDRMVRVGDTLYALRRTGRTRGAVWHVGHAATDRVGLTDQACDDQRVRVVKHGATLKTIARLNPALDAEVQLAVAAMEFTQNQLEYLLNK